ncbi:hypothetical protein KI387_031269, partial [Taxus chinensis]
ESRVCVTECSYRQWTLDAFHHITSALSIHDFIAPFFTLTGTANCLLQINVFVIRCLKVILNDVFFGDIQDLLCSLVCAFPCNLLKIWNLNKHTGVLGVFNCQHVGWCQVDKKNLIHEFQSKTNTATLFPKDVDYFPKIADENWN